MFEFLLDAANIQPDYTIYIVLMLGLTVRFIWIWRLEFLFISTIQTSSECNIQAKNLSIRMKKMLNSCPPITWVIRYIRKKESPGEDPDHYFLSQ